MKNWNRRTFMTGLGATASVIALTNCSKSQSNNPSNLPIQPENIEPIIKSETLEKPNLTIGFVPINDCAVFAIAWQKGFFRKYGLNVTLSREASWANARDGLIFGRLDAVPVVSGAITNARLGAEGAKPVDLCAAMNLSRHGNGLTMNRAIWDGGIRPWIDYEGNEKAFGQDFRNYFRKIDPEDRVWAIPSSSIIYNYFIRYLMAMVGMNPDEEFRIIITPPPQMVSNMRIGAMQAYTVADPWNTRAIKGYEGIGFTFIQGWEVWRGHPDRLLAVRESFINDYPKTYRSLVKAMIESCQYCSKPENREEVAQIISQRSFTGANVKFTRPSIVGDYNYGGFDDKQRIIKNPETTVFYDLSPDISTETNDHSTFMWQSQCIWLMTQATRWGQIKDFPPDAEKIAQAAWKTDLYREIANEMGIKCPSDNYKVEHSSAFIDGKRFDPSDPVKYLQSFDIRSNRRQFF